MYRGLSLIKNNPVILRGWAVHFTNMVGNKLYLEEVWCADLICILHGEFPFFQKRHQVNLHISTALQT